METMISPEEILRNFQRKRILVTGHTGFKGSWLSYWLTELNAMVCGYSIDVPTEPSFFEVLGLEKKMRHELEDIRDYDSILKVIKQYKPEIIFHLAAQSITRQGLRNPRVTFATNALGTVNLLEAVREVGNVQAVVCITSDKCYQNNEWEYGYRENDRLGGKDPYSASKASAEHAIHAYYHSFFKNQGVGLASARAGNVIGGGDWAIDRIVPDCVRAWSVGEMATVRNVNATRPWQHVLEPLYGYLSLGAHLLNKQPCINGEAFNFGPNEVKDYTVEDVVKKMSDYWMGSQWKSIDAKSDQESHLLKLSTEKAWKQLGWKTQLDFQESVKWTSDWYQAYYYERDVLALTQEQIKSFEKRLCKQEYSNSK